MIMGAQALALPCLPPELRGHGHFPSSPVGCRRSSGMHGPAGTSIIHALAPLSWRAGNWEEMAIKLQVQIRNCIWWELVSAWSGAVNLGGWRQWEDWGGGERQRWQQLSLVVGLEFGVWFCCATNSGPARGVSSVRTEGSSADELHRISLRSAARVSEQLICSPNILPSVWRSPCSQHCSLSFSL